LGSKQESLNRRIRETLSSLSDDDLVNMRRTTMQNYTPFARQVAEEEISRRRRMKAARTEDASVVHAADPSTLRTLRTQAAGDKRADCYIEVWTEKNFEGEHLRIEGPVECQTLEVASLEWGGTISSLRVGPTAFVLVYAEKGFKGAMMSFGLSQEVPNLEELNFNDEIDSIRLVSSIKLFDGLRAEDATDPGGARPPEEKRNKEVGRRKPRTRRNR
jgi:Beta/Gamma crystallin